MCPSLLISALSLTMLVTRIGIRSLLRSLNITGKHGVVIIVIRVRVKVGRIATTLKNGAMVRSAYTSHLRGLHIPHMHPFLQTYRHITRAFHKILDV